MNKYSDEYYDKPRLWINEAHKKGLSWGQIEYAGMKDDDGLIVFLEQQTQMNFWEEYSLEDWKKLVALQKDGYENSKSFNYQWQRGILHGKHLNNDIYVPSAPHSCWQLYRKKLIDNKGFEESVVDEMETTTLRILKNLNSDTRESEPIKGLVVGNVQSGKTANMAGLMAMAADWGWNMFIVLSGTIENLREQTQGRLIDDLNNTPCNISWHSVNKPSSRSAVGDRAQDLHFNEESNERYLTVCLKNSTRLKNLIEWIQNDAKTTARMRILVIDDEADQASINTLVEKNEITKINEYLTKLVNGYTTKGQKIKLPYFAMNYIGYTATPYANILNDSANESLYPKDFIATLGLSKQYFGPQQLFGDEDGKYEGLNIIRTVSKDDINLLSDIHDGNTNKIPVSLENSLCWFLCGVAVMRFRKYRKPVSMLIHTSQKTDHHQHVAEAVRGWFSTHSSSDILNKCKAVWDIETSEFNKAVFKDEYPDYSDVDNVPDYPDYYQIEPIIRNLINQNLNFITLGDDNELEYSTGVHLCIDNCKKNKGLDGMHLRLAYPDKEQSPCDAPAFIVIGGATLARGLTIEGLISTYFLRSATQADTLMQMGRWFGYRKGYELLPRVWMTEKSRKQFKFLAELDEELRMEIVQMDKKGQTPDEYGVRIKNTPQLSFIRITAKNKMAKAISADYTGLFKQTYVFDDDKSILDSNLRLVTSFIDDLGDPDESDVNNKHGIRDAIWRNVPFANIKKLLKSYNYHSNLSFVSSLPYILSWIDEMTKHDKLSDWDVIVSGGGIDDEDDGNIIQTKSIKIHKVERSRKKQKSSDAINIGVLSDPRDFLADIDTSKLTYADKADFDHADTKQMRFIRNTCYLKTTPQLMIYIVDKDSKARENGKTREDLNAPQDIAGICFNIPGGTEKSNYFSQITIDLDGVNPFENIFDDSGDMEGTNAD